jgi:hypothetical protein
MTHYLIGNDISHLPILYIIGLTLVVLHQHLPIYCLPNAKGQPAATEPAQHDRRCPLGCADLLDGAK